MNHEFQDVVARLDEIGRSLSSSDGSDDDGEVDRIVMNLAGEKVKHAVENSAGESFGDFQQLPTQ